MKKNSLVRGLLVLSLIALFVEPSFAQGSVTEGANAISGVANDLKAYWEPIKIIIYVIGGIIGMIGAFQVFSKWQNQDQDVNKALMGWGGSFIFLIIAPSVIEAFFNL